MVGTLTGFDDSGAKITIPNDSRGRPTVLYVFSQSCVWCRRSIPALRRVVTQGSERFRFVAVDLSAPFAPSKPYLSANNLTFEESFHPDPETRARIGAEGTPTTLVVGEDGRVEKVFDGALIGSNEEVADKFFTGLGTPEDHVQSRISASSGRCIQDGLLFSSGFLVCRQGHAYACEPGKGWQDAGTACTHDTYVAKSPPAR